MAYLSILSLVSNWPRPRHYSQRRCKIASHLHVHSYGPHHSRPHWRNAILTPSDHPFLPPRPCLVYHLRSNPSPCFPTNAIARPFRQAVSHVRLSTLPQSASRSSLYTMYTTSGVVIIALPIGFVLGLWNLDSSHHQTSLWIGAVANHCLFILVVAESGFKGTLLFFLPRHCRSNRGL
ncbi:hypothetical protein F5Y12DRAFT_739818 [Xylaria sp. FL1777]|nr:hypothetical protein F5Y12DRAFT_739818 [Xylaria sp. FL1777]